MKNFILYKGEDISEDSKILYFSEKKIIGIDLDSLGLVRKRVEKKLLELENEFNLESIELFQSDFYRLISLEKIKVLHIKFYEALEEEDDENIKMYIRKERKEELLLVLMSDPYYYSILELEVEMLEKKVLIESNTKIHIRSKLNIREILESLLEGIDE